MVIRRNPSPTIRVATDRGSLADVFSIEAPAWQARSLCSQVGGEFFFPESGTNASEAKKICGQCPVKSRCLEHALRHHIRHGVWGGLSERERMKLDTTRPCKTCEKPIPKDGHKTPKYCSDECRKAGHDAARAAYDERRRLSSPSADTHDQSAA